MSEPIAFLNGSFVPQRLVMLPLHDAGFVMGATVTDLCRTFHHQLYRWEDHLSRFRKSCAAARIVAPQGDEELTGIAQELVMQNANLLRPAQDLALVLFATPGPVGYYAGLDGGVGDGLPTFGMHTFPLPFRRYQGLFRQGAHLAVPTTRQVSATSVDPRIKQRSRMHWWLADREVQAIHPGAMAVLRDESGFLSETAAANIIIVKGGTLYTPPRRTVLNGISLLTVEELCGELGIDFVEQPLTIQDAESADEMILTSTPYCLCGVGRFNGKTIPWPGPIFERLLAAWSRRVGLDIRGQIESDQ